MGGSAVEMLTTFNKDDDDKDKDTLVYEKYDPLLHGSNRKKSDDILSIQFMKKYINIAKCMKPKLTEAACELISNEYSRLRSQDSMESNVAHTQPVTARTLETLIRLSTAHAKARMAKTVTAQDAESAIELVQFAYFKKVLAKEKKKRRRDDVSSDEEMTETPAGDDTETTQSSSRKSKRTRVEKTQDSENVFEYDSDDDVEQLIRPVDSGDLTQRETRRTDTESSATTSSAPMIVDEEPNIITDERLVLFKNGLQRAFRESREQSLSLAKITAFINRESGDVVFAESEINAAVERMTDDNQIMAADGIVFLI